MTLFGFISGEKEKSAFTLAEVLITIAIVGIVAAFVIPVLVTNVQSDVKSKRVENIKQKLSKATDKMAVQSGLTGYGETMAFVQELSKQMKLAKICDNNHLDACWPTKIVDLNKDKKTWEIAKTKNAKTLKINKEVRDSWADTVGIVTADGTAMILSYKKDCDINIDKAGLVYSKGSALSNTTACLSGVFDWNGSKNPNKLGDDVITLGMATGLGTECAIEAGGKCFTSAFAPAAMSKSDCEAQKDKLGIKYCREENDYWAGTVKQCGGIKNMPTIQELSELAKILYTGNVKGADGYLYGGHLNKSLATSLGITFSKEADYFYVWSRTEIFDGGYSAQALNFWEERTDYGMYGDSRSYSGNQAMCLGD